MGRVKEIAGPAGPTRFANAFRVAFVTALTLAVGLPATALGASNVSQSTETDPFKLDPITELPLEVTVLRVEGGPESSVIRVSLAGELFTVTDTGGATAGTGCTQVNANTVTCSRTGVHRIDKVDLSGGDGADTLIGSPIADIIDAGPRDDIINSGFGGIDTDPGSATYCGAPEVAFGACTDQIDGGASGGGFDTITFADRPGSISVDLRLTPGRDSFDSDGTSEGIANVESVIGGPFTDEIVGGIANDRLNGGPGNLPDVICGSLGNDTVDYSDKTAAVYADTAGLPDQDPATPGQQGLPTDPDLLDPGGSAVSAGARIDCRPVQKSQGLENGLPCTSQSQGPSCAAYPLRDCTADDGVQNENDCVGEDIENIIGGEGDDVLIGNDPDPWMGRSPRIEPSGENVLTGGPGNDFLDGGLGADILDGGDGTDVVSYEGRNERVEASIDGSANDGSSLDHNPRNNTSDQLQPSIEDIIGGNGADVLKGDDGGNVLLGGPGDDLIQGLGGGDDMAGDEGVDTLEGGPDNDLLDGGPGDDGLHGGGGRDAFDGGDGTDTADYSDATGPVSVIPNGLADDGQFHEGDNVSTTVESLIGGLDDDTLVGNDGNGKLQGGGGNDTLDGGLGADEIFGGTGLDTASYGARGGPVNVDLGAGGGDGAPGENDSVNGGDVEGVLGGSGDDVIGGGGDTNILNGGPGNDRVSGAGGDDNVAGDVGNDTLNGDGGNDIVDGAEGNDTVNGGAGNDTLRGFAGTDVVDGGAGSDNMSGGVGLDTASYAGRSADVSVDTQGTPNDGERNENDLVRTDIESVRTGGGDDTINIVDGAAGTATCGAGRDEVTADADDEVGSGCESSLVRQAAICTPASSSVRMSGSGVVSLRLRCAFNARGTVRLVSASPVKAGKGKARRLTLGSKSFTGKKGQLTVKVKVSKSARSLVKRRKSLRVQATMRTRRATAGAAMRTNKRTLTVKAGK